MGRKLLGIYKINPKLLEGLDIKEFKPFARFIESLNCIEILIRDCSFYEKKINLNVSVLIDNDEKDFVGIIVWGIKKNLASAYLNSFKGFLGITANLVMGNLKVEGFIYHLRGQEISLEKVG